MRDRYGRFVKSGAGVGPPPLRDARGRFALRFDAWRVRKHADPRQRSVLPKRKDYAGAFRKFLEPTKMGARKTKMYALFEMEVPPEYAQVFGHDRVTWPILIGEQTYTSAKKLSTKTLFNFAKARGARSGMTGYRPLRLIGIYKYKGKIK